MENRGDSLTENQKNTAPEEEERLRQEFYMEQVRAYLREHFAGRKKCPSFCDHPGLSDECPGFREAGGHAGSDGV